MNEAEDTISGEELREQFVTFRQSRPEQVRIAVRRHRVSQLQSIIRTGPVDLEVFNKEVWPFESSSSLDGAPFNARRFFEVLPSDSLLSQVERALEGGGLELHGNYIWGTGSRVYGAMLIGRTETDKADLVARAIELARSESLSPVEKAEAILEIPGFGPNAATGLLMVLDPRGFALWNRPSKETLSQLGYEVDVLRAFQESVAELREQLGASDFLELDWFLYKVSTGEYLPPEPGEAAESGADGDEVTAGRGITRAAVLRAIEECESLGPDRFRDKYGFGRALKYRVIHEGKSYDSKAIYGVAYGYAHPDAGPLLTNDFTGGEWSVVRPLKKLGFVIAVGDEEAQDDDPLTAGSTATDGRLRSGFETVLRTYEEGRLTAPFGGEHEAVVALRTLADDLAHSLPVGGRADVEVRWSAGRGNWAKVPWLACLDLRETSSIEEGTYVVYLFRQDMSGVYVTLAQGVTRLRQDHGMPRAREILRSRARNLAEDFGDELAAAGFAHDEGIDLRADAGLGSQYETSTIAYKLYEAGRVPDDPQLLQDLDAVLEVYGRHALNRREPRRPVTPRADLQAVCEEFNTHLREGNLFFGDRQDEFVRSFVAALATKPFVILTGLSGSGKTQLAIKLGEWFGEGRLLVEPVRPDWTGAEALFGYEDALQPASSGRRAWTVPRPLAFILTAAGDPDWPYLLVLDEMNLAHVERYFADVLSGMESRLPAIQNLIRNDDGLWRAAMATQSEDRLPVPRNLFVAGTVNVDETTYMFSPKVLDRANTFEFRVETGDLSPSAVRPGSISPGSPELVRGLLELAVDDDWHGRHPAPSRDTLVQHLRVLHGLLSEGGFEFGHRVFYEVIRFAAMLAAAGNADADTALDRQVMQKVLPRLHGSRRRLEPSLAALGRFCFDLSYEPGELGETTSFDPLNPGEGSPRLPLSFGKVRRMMRTLRANQFASFTD